MKSSENIKDRVISKSINLDYKINCMVSDVQQKIWLFEQRELGTAAYNIPVLWHLSGSLNINALERSLEKIVKKHEILRTCFIWSDKYQSPVQVVRGHAEIALSHIDVTRNGDKDWQNV
ncbi:MAG: hypothetical protein GY874_05700 [Desulfobacteraceae bacterium]|nr:hypothetical protein [Desulfobacteraceae bacterium]